MVLEAVIFPILPRISAEVIQVNLKLTFLALLMKQTQDYMRERCNKYYYQAGSSSGGNIGRVSNFIFSLQMSKNGTVFQFVVKNCNTYGL